MDANVLSEVTRPDPDSRIVTWIRHHQTEMAIDPIILGELRFGILKLAAGAKRRRLEQWFERGIRKIHCLTWDAEIGLLWAQLIAELRQKGRTMPIKDSMIAATALGYGLSFVTLNRRDFDAAGVELVTPWTH